VSNTEKLDVLKYLMFLNKKVKWDNKRPWVCRWSQIRPHTKKEDAHAPTVALETLMLSCITYAMEKRDVATIDLPGAFMQADMDEEVVHLCLHGKMAELVQLDPKLYQKYVQLTKGKPML